MNPQIRAISAEFLKNRHSGIRWVTFVAFAIAPVMGGLFMFLMKGAGPDGLSGILKSKAVMMSIEATWDSYLGILSQAVGVGGVLLFGFVASWLFGREYADGTAKDLLALPVSRTQILNAKYIYYVLWCFSLVIFNLILGLLIGFSFQLPGWSFPVFLDNLGVYLITTLLIIILNTPIAFFAIWSKGYLTPLGIVVLLLVLSQIIGAVGFGAYFPWSVPALYSGSGGEEFRMQLTTMSFVSLIAIGIIGYLGTVFWWKYADQK